MDVAVKTSEPMTYPIQASLPRPISTLHLQDRTRGLRPEDDKKIVPGPPAAKPFPVHIEWNGQDGEEWRRPAENVHDLFRTVRGRPLIGVVGQTVKPGVLKEHVHDEHLSADAPEGVQRNDHDPFFLVLG